MFLIGKGNICQIIYEKNNPAAQYAATELSKYLFRSMGLELKTLSEEKEKKERAFFIGGEKVNSLINVSSYDLNGDGFVLDIAEESVCLAAQNGRGFIFGVYRFLEKYLGIRFFNPACEKIPQLDKIELKPCRIVERPEFALRSYLNGALWECGGADKDLYLKFKQNNEHLIITESQYGGRCSMYGRNGTHNMATYVPYEKYKDTHPEFYYYNEDLGYRTIDLLNGITEDGKLDESVEISVAKIVLEELKKDVLANPDIVYFQFEQEDGLDTVYPYEEGTKEYALLQKYQRSGLLIRFCNLLAREIQKWSNETLGGREINIVTFAYGSTKEPPVLYKNGEIVPIDNSVVAEDNIVIRFAMGTSAVNYAYDHFHEKNEYFLNSLAGWRKIARKFAFWCYDMDDVTHLWYYPVLKNVKRNIQGFKEMGAIYLMFEAGCSSIHDWQTDLRGYIYSNLMWNSQLSVNDLFNEYVENYYGVASSEVKKIIAILENYCIFMREIYDGYYVSTFNWSYRHADVQSEKLIDRVLVLCSQAEKKVEALAENERKIFNKRLKAVKLTLLHMKINKNNWEFYKCVEESETTQFSGQDLIPKNEGQTIHNVELVWRVKEKLIIPKEVVDKVKELDPYSISDEINFDTVI